MPRFASDLSFNPLEPAKFSSSSTSSYRNNSTVNSSSIIKSKAKDNKDIEKVSTDAPQAPDIVPEFDWSVAGLTNPLDGKMNN